MTACSYPELDETLYRETLENGLTVLVVPKKGFTKRLAYFVTDFGSIHTDFTLDGKEYHAPAGVAHYLLGLLLRRGKRGVHVGADIEAIRLPAHFHPGQLVHFRPGGGLQTLHRHIHFPQQLRNQSALLLQQCQKQMHLFHLLMGILNRQLLCALDDFNRFLGIVIEVHLLYLPFALALSSPEC